MSALSPFLIFEGKIVLDTGIFGTVVHKPQYLLIQESKVWIMGNTQFFNTGNWQLSAEVPIVFVGRK